ncbi:putative Golgi apparatus membrane protein [Clavispora lusitaniae]|uniref:Golgi apparatus membrane protein TVP23 n=1 Tax=Clavispora lusitaniae TaxID=36911 RepID=A0AA91Q0R2_CLALS|nr:putative Golgi apparatus membrane protein [Clavispora lusitaniae]
MSQYTPIEADEIVPDIAPSDNPSNPHSYNANASALNSAGPPQVSGSIPAAENIQERTWSQRLQESSHPIALLFFIFFRIAPIFVYLFGSIILSLVTKNSRFILHFIILILLVSADFWNLKNISGRLLVGLRWWNETNMKQGSNEFENVWVFESADPNRYINPIDSKVFWTLLYVQPLAWIVFAIMAVLKLELLYLIVVAISVFLSLTNAVAFTKCDKFGKANVMANDIFSKATGGLLNRFNPFA